MSTTKASKNKHKKPSQVKSNKLKSDSPTSLLLKNKRSKQNKKKSYPLEKRQTSNSRSTYRFTNNPSNQKFDPNKKLTHDELMSLSEEKQIDYCEKHGGAISVMRENGYGLTEEDIKDWEQMKDDEDKEWREEYKRLYGKEVSNLFCVDII